jgi:DNA-binding beta-propeller fold protein YncE
MALRHLGYVDLPAHARPGGFDHAAIHRKSGRIYVAHTANDALDVIDSASDIYLRSIPGLTEVAGALVDDDRDLVFTSNRGENTVGIFPVDHEDRMTKVSVGLRPNGLAYDPTRGLLLAANVGDPAVAGSFTVSMVNVSSRTMIASVPVPGRTRWAVFDPQAEAFYVNIMDPARIVVIDTAEPARVVRSWEMPAAGPHGLDLDAAGRRLFCACDSARLLTVDCRSGSVLGALTISGKPDVVFFNPALKRLYVAVGDPGVIDVIDTAGMRAVESVPTEKGAHSIAFDARTNKVYAFLPFTHRASVYAEVG